MELNDTFTGPVVSIHRCDGDIDIHADRCRGLGNQSRYPERNQTRHDAGVTGADMVLEWFDDGILDEEIADRFHRHGGDKNSIRDEIMAEYAFMFSVKSCAVRLVSKQQ